MECLADNRLKSVDTESNEFEKTVCKWRSNIVSLSFDVLHGVFLPKQIMEMK